MSTFSDKFCLDEAKKLMLKITITYRPNDMTDEALVSKICDKDVFLNDEINTDKILDKQSSTGKMGW